MHPISPHHRRTTIAAAAVALWLLCLLPAAPAGAATAPSFLLASAPHGALVHARPGGAVVARLPSATPLGSPTWLWVLSRSGDGRWGRVVLPLRPNGRTGWIDLRGLRTVRTSTWVRASLRARRIWLMRGSAAVASFGAAIGAPSTSTPTGRFSVTDRVLTGDPAGPFGWYAFGLSGHQPNLPPQWAGGDQLAIHGTNDPASIGTPASHGCLRVSAAALARLRATLQLGMPVVIMPTAGRAMALARRSSLTPAAPEHRPAWHQAPAHAPAFELHTTRSRLLLARTMAEPAAPPPAATTPAIRRRRTRAGARRDPILTGAPQQSPLISAPVPPTAIAPAIAGHGRSPPG